MQSEPRSFSSGLFSLRRTVPCITQLKILKAVRGGAVLSLELGLARPGFLEVDQQGAPSWTSRKTAPRYWVLQIPDGSLGTSREPGETWG